MWVWATHTSRAGCFGACARQPWPACVRWQLRWDGEDRPLVGPFLAARQNHMQAPSFQGCSFKLLAPRATPHVRCCLLYAPSCLHGLGRGGGLRPGPLPHHRRCIWYRSWHVGGWPAGLWRVRRLTAAATVERPPSSALSPRSSGPDAPCLMLHGGWCWWRYGQERLAARGAHHLSGCWSVRLDGPPKSASVDGRRYFVLQRRPVADSVGLEFWEERVVLFFFAYGGQGAVAGAQHGVVG